MDNTVEYIPGDKCYVFTCPHCKIPVQVEENQVNCCIFRHGQMKDTYVIKFSSRVEFNVPEHRIKSVSTIGSTVQVQTMDMTETYEEAQILAINRGQQIAPHAPKNICENLRDKDLIWGCGKPFRLVKDSSNMVKTVEVCDYI